MLLSSQHFAEILAHLRRQSGGQKDKRRAPRTDVRAKITILPFTAGSCGRPIAVLTRDMSMDGIGLLTTVTLGQGQQVVLRLPRNDTTTVLVLCDVRYCGLMADGLYALGCSYLRAMKPEEARENVNESDVERIRRSVLS